MKNSRIYILDDTTDLLRIRALTHSLSEFSHSLTESEYRVITFFGGAVVSFYTRARREDAAPNM